jgi:hypothetical protein
MTSGTSPAFQSTVTTTIPLSLSLTNPSSTGLALALSATTDPVSARLVQNPEPSTILLLASGLAGLAWYGSRRRRAAMKEEIIEAIGR